MPTPATTAPVAGDGLAQTFSFDPTNLGAWIALTLSLLIALLGSSVLATLITRHGNVKATTTASRRSDARRAMKSLRQLRTVYLECADGVVDPATAGLADLTNRLYVSVAFTGSKDLVEATQRYVMIGELYAAQDQLTSTDDEAKRFFELLDLLRKYLG